MSLTPVAPLKLIRCPRSLAASLAVLPSMSLIPSAPLYLGSSRCARPLPRGFTGHVAHPSRSIGEFRLLELIKTDSASWWFWLGRRIQDLHDLAQDLHDRRLMHVQSSGELCLKCSEFPRQLRRAAKCLAHFRKGAHNKNAHLNSPCAV